MKELCVLDINDPNHDTSFLDLLYVADTQNQEEPTLIILKKIFKNILIVDDAKEALSKYMNNPMDLIIIDIDIPHALEMMQEIRHKSKQVSILVLSSHTESEYFMQSIKIGVDGYILKPIDEKQLLTTLEKVIHKYRLEYETQKNLALLQEYQDIIDKSSIVSKTDIFGIITYVNDKFCQTSKYTREELLGQNHNIIRHPDSKASQFEEMWDTIKNKKQIFRAILKNRTKDNQEYYVDSTVKPILNHKGDIVEYIAIRHDITQIIQLHKRINQLHDYDVEQQHSAKEKLEVGIRNDMDSNEAQVIYTPLDILSGDFYSIYKCVNEINFFYILDGQGHGISPALTVFSISSIINNMMRDVSSLAELIANVFPIIKTFLSEIEQLSYTMVMINNKTQTLEYASGGMYPFLIKSDSKVEKFSANNLPFMNFSPIPIVKSIELKKWDAILLYSDGLVEHEDETLKSFSPHNLISNPTLITKAQEVINNAELYDDITMLHIANTQEL